MFDPALYIPGIGECHILFNSRQSQGESGAVRDAYIRQVDGNTIEGYVITEPEYVKKYQAGASVAMYFLCKIGPCAGICRSFLSR